MLAKLAMMAASALAVAAVLTLSPLTGNARALTVNARTYGALGNGVHDDTAALVKAVRSVHEKGGGTLYLPKGHYVVSALTVTDGVNLKGAGASASWLEGRVTAGSNLTLSYLKLGVRGAAFDFTRQVSHTLLHKVRFVGGSSMDDMGCVVQLKGVAASFVTFLSCTIGANPYDGNGVSVTPQGWSGGDIHDVVFRGCHFRGSPRMNFECTQRQGSSRVTLGYHDINLIKCVFEPSGSECISYDDGTGFGAGRSTISGCTIKGAGWNSAYPWHQGVEFNKVKSMKFIGNTVYRCQADVINHTGLGPNVDCGVVYRDNVFDSTRSYIKVTPYDGAQVIYLSDVHGATFSGNLVKNNAGGPLLGLVSSCGNTFTSDRWIDPRQTSAGAACVYLSDDSRNNSFASNRFDSYCTPALTFFKSGSDGNLITNSIFVTHNNRPVWVDPGIVVTQVGNTEL